MLFRRQRLLLLLVSIVSLTGFACKKEEQQQPPTTGIAPIASKAVPAFDADRAFSDVEKQVAFGPRVPNSTAHDNELEFLRTRLLEYTQEVQLQPFTSPGYANGETLKLTNVIASFNPDAKWRLLILTHYDSRPRADQDPDKSKHDQPVPAANDGGSGTAIMLELARQFKDNPPPIGVDLLFDDGEDYGNYDIDKLDRYFLGTKYYVKVKPDSYTPRFAILLDMVGDKNAIFAPEATSLKAAPQFTAEVYHTAVGLGLTHFREMGGQEIQDDHLPLISAGIPSVDLIDAELVGANTTDPDRKYWHTTDDLPKHISPATLGEVGKLLLNLIYDRLPQDVPSL